MCGEPLVYVELPFVVSKGPTIRAMVTLNAALIADQASPMNTSNGEHVMIALC